MSVSKDLVDVIKASNDKETKAYDTQATVTRVEGSTVWVHIPGGVDETPVKKTVNAKEGDIVQVRVSGGSAWLMGNASSPPTDDTTALLATQYARTANVAAESAVQSAKIAGEAAADAVATANSVKVIADEAKEHADVAKSAAENATLSANTALTQLSVVEDVVGTLNWISEHGKYNLTKDSHVVPEKVYFTRTGSGTSSDPYIYSPVIEPKDTELSNYYELTIDDAVSTYISMHLALTNEGLYVMNEKTKWKVLIANDGVYIIDDNNKTVAKYKNVITLGHDDGTQNYQKLDYHSLQLVDKEGNSYLYVSDLRDKNGLLDVEDYFPTIQRQLIFDLKYEATNTNYTVRVNGVVVGDDVVTKRIDSIAFAVAPNAPIRVNYTTRSIQAKAYTLGLRQNDAPDKMGAFSVVEGYHNSAQGNYSHSGGYCSVAKGRSSFAHGDDVWAVGDGSVAFGNDNDVNGNYAYGGGIGCQVNGFAAFAHGRSLIADSNQMVCGEFNVEDDTSALIVGNGSSSGRSNAFAVSKKGIPFCRNPRNDYASIFLLIYPVGSIYMSANNVSPALLFGGTWEQIKDRFLLAAGNTYAAGGTGGSADASLPAHTHTVSGTAASNGAHTHTVSGTAASNGAHSHGMGSIWSDGSGSASAYTMSTNRKQKVRNTSSAGAHTHSVSGTAASNGAHTHSVSGTAASTGVSAAGKNMPPYLTVYMWKRTA